MKPKTSANRIRNRLITDLILDQLLKAAQNVDLMTKIGEGNDHHADTEIYKLIEEIKKLMVD